MPGCCYATAKSEWLLVNSQWLLCVLVVARVMFGCQGVAMQLLKQSEWLLAHCQWLLCVLVVARVLIGCQGVAM